MTDTFRPSTLALHGGQVPDPATNARAVPVYQTTSYVFNSAEHAASLFALQEFGNIYTRIMNPTTDVLEKRLAAFDGGVGALAVASGQSAITLAVLEYHAGGPEHRVDKFLYGGHLQPLSLHAAETGHSSSFRRFVRSSEFESAIDEKTRLLYTESIGNPKNNVDDFEAIGQIAHRRHLPLCGRQHRLAFCFPAA